MRKIGLIGLLAALTLAATSTTNAVTPPIARYCSPSGDICYGVFKRSGAIYLDLSAQAEYFSKYRLCIRKGAGSWRCRTYPLRRIANTFGSTVRFATHYRRGGPGVYRARWSLGSRPLGPVLRFRVR